MGIVIEEGMAEWEGVGIDCIGMEGNGNVKSHSRTSLVRSQLRSCVCGELVSADVVRIGLRMSNATFNALAIRYSDKDGRVAFDDFAAAYMKLKSLFGWSDLCICTVVSAFSAISSLPSMISHC